MYTASEKLAIIRLVEDSELSVRRTLDEIKVSRSSFYRWYDAYERAGLDGLERKGRASDVTDTLEDALKATGLSEARVRHKPRLLSDNGPCYISGELKAWLKNQDMEHTRGAPYHPQTQGKIERYHRSMKNVVKLENYYYPWELEKAITAWVAHYSHERHHESLNNVTPADVYEGRRNKILDQRALVKMRTLNKRKVHNLLLAG